MSRDRIREPHPRRLPLDHPRRAEIVTAHLDAVESGAPTYVDPATGFSVFTAVTLLERGTCCESGCRHCPYLD